MKSHFSRRHILKIIASSLTIFPYEINASENNNLHSYNWDDVALGNPVSMQIISKNKNQLEKLIYLISAEIKRFDNIFYLQNGNSQINLLNKYKLITNPDIELIKAINLAEKFYSLSNKSFDITVQPIWNSIFTKTKINYSGIGFNNILLNKRNIKLLNKNTEITLNSLAQGILTDKIHDLLYNSGFKIHMINFGEGRTSGILPDNKNWNLIINNKKLDVTNKGYSVTEAKSTLLPGNNSHLIDVSTYKTANNAPKRVTVIANSATLADALSTVYSVSDIQSRKKILENFPEAKFIIET